MGLVLPGLRTKLYRFVFESLPSAPLTFSQQKPPTFISANHADRTRLRGNRSLNPAGNEPPDVTGKNVLIVDFAYSLPATRRMMQQAKKLIILDHHQTSALRFASLTPSLISLHRHG